MVGMKLQPAAGEIAVSQLRQPMRRAHGASKIVVIFFYNDRNFQEVGNAFLDEKVLIPVLTSRTID